MSLIGKYTNKKLGATLTITSANNADGSGSGTFSMGGIDYEVALHYHFDNNVGPNTVLQIWTSNTYGWDYIGAAGFSASTDGSVGISLSGGTGSVNDSTSFSGMFTK